MALRQRDYILRMIEQLAEAMARIVGARKAGDLHQARQLLRETADGLFGPLCGMLEKVDAASAAMLLADGEKIRAYAALVVEEANILEQEGELGRAKSLRRRALDLYLEAVAKKATLRESDHAAMRRLREQT